MNYDPLNPDHVKRVKKEMHEAFLAYVYLQGSDHTKYGELLKHLSGQYALGQDQFLKSVTMVTNILSNHKYDDAYAERLKQNKQNCEKQQNENEEDKQQLITFLQFEGKCWCCSKKGHQSPQCPDNNKPKRDWAINKMQQMQAAQQAIISDMLTWEESANITASMQKEDTTVTTTTQGTPFWAGGAGFCQIMAAMTRNEVSLVQLSELEELLVLDNASSEHVICNNKLVDKIWESDTKLALATNGGPFVSCTKDNIPGCCEAWVEPGSVTNIFSLILLSDKF